MRCHVTRPSKRECEEHGFDPSERYVIPGCYAVALSGDDFLTPSGKISRARLKAICTCPTDEEIEQTYPVVVRKAVNAWLRERGLKISGADWADLDYRVAVALGLRKPRDARRCSDVLPFDP